METIEVRYKPIAGTPAFHKYFIYTDSSGNQTYARGGPAIGDGYEARNPLSPETITGPYAPFGQIVVEYGPFVDSPLNPDWDPTNTHPRETVKSGSDLSTDFTDIINALDAIQDLDLVYELLFNNSNSVIDTVLQQLGFPQPMLDGQYYSPGSGMFLPDTSSGYPGDSDGDGRNDGNNGGGGPGGGGPGGGGPGGDGPKPPEFPNREGDQGSPLVLDLDGDGIELYAKGDYGTYFDLQGNGQAVLTGWVEPDDGLLALDINGDGIINDITELFGSIDTDGFTELAVHDTNNDDVIDSNDNVFTDLLIWTDVNSDGVSQVTELHSLTDYNIASISLDADRLAQTEIAGNDITHEATYTLTDGAERTIVDAWFTYDVKYTQNIETYSIDERVLYMPTFKGYGDLKDLHQALSIDNGSGVETLMSLVVDLADGLTLSDAFSDLTTLDNGMENVLLRWAGADGTDPTSRGSYVDARHLAFNEAFRGEAFSQYGRSNPLPEAGEYSEAVYAYFKTFYTSQFLTQVVGNEIFVQPQYNLYTAGIDGDLTLLQTGIDTIEAVASDINNDAVTVWTRFAEFLGYTKGLSNLTVSEITALDAAVLTTGEPSLDDWQDVVNAMTASLGSIIEDSADWGTFEIFYDNDIEGTSAGDTLVDTNAGGFNDNEFDGKEGNDTIQGLDGHDKLIGGLGNDTLEGGLGDDYLLGGVGDDIYVYESGNDTFSEVDGSGMDEIRVLASTNLTTANVTDFYRISDDLLILLDTGDFLTIDNYSAQNAEIEKIVFEFDNSEIDLFNTLNQKFYGTSGRDNISGTAQNFQVLEIYGFEGNDTIEANGAAAEFYGGDGYDTLIGDFQNDDLYGDGEDDYLIGLDGDDDLYGGDQNDVLLGGDGNDNLDGGRGNDVLDGGAGDDILDGAGAGVLDSQAGEDTFIYGRGYGNDTIIRTVGGNDKLEFTGTLALSEIELLRDTSSAIAREDLTIRIVDTGETLLINDGFNHITGNNWATNIKLYEFSDGTVLSDQDIRNLYFASNITAGDDITYGFDAADIFTSTTGNDELHGLKGDDTYYWGASLGNDIIFENTDGSSVVDRVIFEGLNLSDVAFSRSTDGRDLIATNNVTSETLIVNNQYNSSGEASSTQIEIFEFFDGLVIDEDIVQQVVDGMFLQAGTTGNDNIISHSGSEIILGRGGGDVVLFAGSYADYTLTGNTSYVSVVDDIGSGGTDTLYDIESLEFVDGTYDVATATFVSNGPLVINGTNGDDTLTGTLSDEIFIGSAGNDTLDGGGGIDTVSYENATAFVRIRMHQGTVTGSGNDVISNFENAIGSDYNDQIFGNAGDNILEGGSGNDTINGLDGNDTVYGGVGNDQLRTGLSGDNAIYGEDGNDLLWAQSTGTTILDGGSGNDTLYIVASATGLKTLAGGAGTDLLSYWSTYQSDVEINLVNGTVDEGRDGNIEVTFTSIEKAYGGAGDDIIIGDDNVNILQGQNGDDVLYGGLGNDTLYGNNGNDILYGEEGNDYLFGSNGNDILYGGVGADTLRGQAGADTFSYLSGDVDGQTDVFYDFSLSDNDLIDVSDVLTGYDPLTDAINDFVQLTDDGTHSYISVDADGGADNYVHIAQIRNVTALGDADTLETNGTLITV